MADDNQNIAPKIDDQYWFDMSEKMVSGSIERLDKAIESVKTLINWAWGVYIASSILTVEYKDVEEWWVLALLSAPYLVLILSYWSSNMAQLPVPIGFDARSPTMIRQAYITTYDAKAKALKSLRWWSFLSLFSMGLALTVAFWVKNTKQPPGTFDGQVVKNAGRSVLLVQGDLPANQKIDVDITQTFKTGKPWDTAYPLLNGRRGTFRCEVPVRDSATTIALTLRWTENEQQHSLGKTFTITP